MLTREPGGSPGAEMIRHVLLSGAAKPFGTQAEAILFAAARDDHVRQRSSRPYAMANGSSATALPTRPAFIKARSATWTRGLSAALNGFPSVTPKPDLTFVLDVPAEEGIAP